MNSRFSLLALFALLTALAPAGTTSGQTSADSSPAPEVSPARALVLAEVVDAEGRPVADVDPTTLRAVRNGAPVAVESAGVGAPDRLVVYFDLPLLTTRQVIDAAGLLADRAAALVDLAEVELVVGDTSSRTVLPASLDPELVSQALAGVGTRYGGRDTLGDIRGRFVEELESLAGRPAADAGSGRSGRTGEPVSRRAPLPPHVVEKIEMLARQALAEEASLLRAQRERLATWAASEGVLGPERSAALILVTGGFDATPLDFYRAALEAYGQGTTVADRLERPVILPSLEELSRVLSAYGWLTIPYVDTGAATGDEGAAGAPEGELEAPSADETLGRPGLDATDQGGDQRPALITPRLGRRDRSESAGPVLPPLRPGGGALAPLADGTGGEVVSDPLQLADLLGRLGHRVRLLVEAVPGEPEALDWSVRGGSSRRQGLVVRAARWAGETPPRSVAAVRVRQLLEGVETTGGALPVEAAFQVPPGGSGGRLTLRLGSPAEPPPAASARVRATIGIDRYEGEPLVFHQTLDPSAAEDGLFEIPVTLPDGSETRVAVLVEELPAGRWGSAFAGHLEAGEGELGEAGGTDDDLLDGGYLPSPRVVRLIAPGEAFVTGETKLSVVVSTPRVQRVDFFLDGQRVAARVGSPFEATLDLGAVPRSRRIEAVAYGEDGTELGRDVLVVNEGGGSFRVRIVEPTTGGSGDKPLVGPVDVEAEVKSPGDARVDRVEFYWNATRVATRYDAPYRQRVVIPASGAQGFLRVVAHLEDGAVAEDVLFVNGPGSGERLEVNLVEMYVVVTDRRGRPVGDLEQKDFRIFEEGESQEISTFRAGADLPLTVGLAIDSSASMFVKLPGVAGAAKEFVRDSLENGDRAFVVSFGGEPDLVQETTGDEGRLLRAVSRLRPVGQTALWESVVYSLVEIQSAPGKKALIVYTDGADEDEAFSYRTALRFSRRVGVPIYFILTNNEIVRTGGKGLGVRRFLGRVERLSEEVGGRVFIVRRDTDLAEVYREIGEELQSQYLLAYYSRDLPEETWRRVKVETVDSGLKTRTITGTYR